MKVLRLSLPARLVAVAGALGAAAIARGGAPTPPAELERAIRTGQAGKVVVTLDRDVYEHARADLGDLRVVDENGAEAPYLLQRVTDDLDPRPSFRQPARVKRGFVRGEGATAVLEFDEPVLKTELVLSLSDDRFSRRIKVEGRAKGEREWTTLTEGAYVLAAPEPARARYESVFLPENNYPFLKLTVYRGPDDPERIEVLDAWVRSQPQRRPREVPLRPGLSRHEDDRAQETVLVLDLQARHQPFRGIVLEVADPEFLRGAVLEARRDSLRAPDGAPAYRWASVTEGALYRRRDHGTAHERLRLDAVGRERVVRLRIRNREERPLQIRGAAVMVPIERLVFEARPGRSYRLTYGVAGRSAPSYEIERTVGDAALWIAQATEAALHPPVPRRLPPPRPWLEDHPRLFWTGSAAVLIVLATLAWRARRRAA